MKKIYVAIAFALILGLLFCYPPFRIWAQTHTTAVLDVAQNFTALQEFSGGVSADGTHNETIPSRTNTLLDGASSLPFSQITGTASTGQLPGSGITTINGTSCTIGSSCTPSPQLIASGTATMGTSSIGASTCGDGTNASASGVSSSDTVTWSYASGPAGSNGSLVFNAWTSSNQVNFLWCNPFGNSFTPSSQTINWRVVR